MGDHVRVAVMGFVYRGGRSTRTHAVMKGTKKERMMGRNIPSGRHGGSRSRRNN